MDLLAAWVLFPVVLAFVSLGAGLLVERASGRRVPGALLIPVGFAAVLVVSRLAVSVEWIAPLGLWLLLALALAGYALGRDRLRTARPDPYAVAAALGVGLVYGAPVLFSGEPTFAGSLMLPDTAHQLTLASFLPEHGTDWESLPASSYKLELEKYLGTAYPIAPQAALGLLAPLGLLEVAWLYQPFLTFMVAGLAATIYALVAPWVESRPLRGLIAFVAAQPALAVSYALQGSIKELTGCAMIVLAAALIARAVVERWSARALVTVAVATAAALGGLGPTAGVYLAPLLAVLGLAWAVRLVRAPSRRELLQLAAVAAVAAMLALPVLTSVQTAYAVNTAVLSNAEDLGNLARPLELGQVSGVWLNGDYRYDPSSKRWLNTAAVLCALAAAALGLAWAVRRRAWGPLLVVGGMGAASLYLLARGSPYADAKVLMILSPAALLLAALAPLLFGERFRRVPAFLLAAGVTGAVLVSNALAYHDVHHAPQARYSELLDLNERLDGRGPVLMTEYDEFGEYLLRDARPYVQPEWPHGYRVGDRFRENGLFDPAHRPSIKTPLDLDDLQTPYVQSVPLILLRRSPTMSRPPSNYRRVWTGHWYELWERKPGTRGTVVAHVPAGRNVLEPAGRPRCSDVLRLARRARAIRGRLAYVPRPHLPVLEPLREKLPPGWYAYGAYPEAVVPIGPGTVLGSVTVPAGGRYRVWVEGSFGRGFEVSVDGRTVGEIRYHQGNPGQYLSAGIVELRSGRHVVALVRPGGDLRPGNGGSDSSLRHFGPVVLSPPANERPSVRYASPGQPRSLCGRWVDWIEAVAPA